MIIYKHLLWSFVNCLLLLAVFATPLARAGEGGGEPQAADALTNYLLGQEFQISTESTPTDAHRYLPAVAYNWSHHEYLVVWHNTWPGNRDIYAQRVSENGSKIGSWFSITSGAKDRLQPAVAYNSAEDEYLVVWMQEDDTRPNVYNIRGRIIAWNNSYQRSEFTIISWANRSFWTPRVAWNVYRDEYFVVWNAFDTTTSFPPGVPNDIAGYRVSSDGEVQNPGIPSLLATTGSPHQVDLVYNVGTDEYFIVYVIVHTLATSGNDIYGRRVTWDGVAQSSIEILKDDYDGGRKHQNHPAVATNNQDKYMVVWEHEYSSTDHDIYAREYNANGTPVGASFGLSTWTQNDCAPDIAANGSNDEWLAVWQRGDGSSGYAIEAVLWGSAGSGVITQFFEVVNWAFYESTKPAVAADIPGYLIVYEQRPPVGYQHIFGRMFWPQALFLPLVIKK